jgi:hypothetical protein
VDIFGLLHPCFAGTAHTNSGMDSRSI